MRTREGNKEQDILEAAITVFAKEGYYNAKISKIAENAGVATGSVYLYFKNKENILQKIFENLWSKIFTEVLTVSKRKDINAVEKFDSMIDLIFDLFTENPDLAVVFVNEQYHLMQTSNSGFTPFYEKFLDVGEIILNEGIAEKYFNPNIDVKIFRHLAFGGIRHLLHQWAQKPKEFPLNAVRQNVKYILRKGLLVS